MFFRVGVALSALVLAPSAASAKWYEAKSRHFIVYSEQKPEELKAYATKLERYDGAVRAARGMADPANEHDRLVVYLLPTADQVGRLAGSQGVLGFWRSKASGAVAFANSEPKRARYDLDGQSVFFHEYLHHMMLQDATRSYPIWMSEGYAEFFGTAQILPDGSVEFGEPPHWRGYHLAKGELYSAQMTLPDMLGGIYNQTTGAEWVSQYGRGWLLTHYLAFEPSRQGQVDKYVNAIQRGVPALDAAKQAFGDLKKLDKDLDHYYARKTIPTRTIPASLIHVGPVEIRPLNPDEEGIIELRMKHDAGHDMAGARFLVGGARKAAEQFPRSVAALTMLAESEYEVKNYAEASAAADRALAIDPKSIPALIYKGRALMELAKANPKAADWKGVRSWFSRANRLNPHAPEPLMLYYESFVKEGATPPSQAVDGLLAAVEWSPFDRNLRLMAVRQMLKEGDGKLAEALFGPISYSAHFEGKERRRDLEIMAKIKTGDATGALKMLEEDQKKRDKENGASL